MLAGGMVWLRVVVGGTGDDLLRLDFAPALMICGIGLGSAISPLFQTILGNVGGQDTGAASGGLQAFQQMGAAVGVAIMGEIFFASLAASLAGGIAPHPAYAGALRNAVIYYVIVFAAIAVLVWRLPAPQPSRQHAPPPVEV
jgi:hypothetical protein